MQQLTDLFGRVHNYLRVSVTDKCNLNCSYCNPNSAKIVRVEKEKILSFDEIVRLIRIFVINLRFSKIRLTGGEPLARHGILSLFELLSALQKQYPFTLGITTNGLLLYDYLPALKDFGVSRLNISLDSLNPENFFRITQNRHLGNIIDAIDKAVALDFHQVKINTVVMRGINDSELIDFVHFAIDKKVNVRFIEYMPFTGNEWEDKQFMDADSMRAVIEQKFVLEKLPFEHSAVSRDYQVKGTDGKVSFISAISKHFCGGCNRLRMMSNGKLKLCLFSTDQEEVDVRWLLREPEIDDHQIADFITFSLRNKHLKHPSLEALRDMESNNMLSIGG